MHKLASVIGSDYLMRRIAMNSFHLERLCKPPATVATPLVPKLTSTVGQFQDTEADKLGVSTPALVNFRQLPATSCQVRSSFLAFWRSAALSMSS